ncbi:hypothetical protein J7E85_01210 [Paenibacillus sp. ISL-20]|nr:hypothetical protein [Paenibacillus sp. ISL-20]
MGKIKDLLGQRFARIKVIEFYGKNKKNGAMWLCECDCGNNKVIWGSDLIRGQTTSCGCLNKERVKAKVTKHGHNKGGNKISSEYRAWNNMIQRCSNPKNNQYKNYGGRGITVCREWLESFQEFFNDMGKKPSAIYSLDRIDVNGNYGPNNCKWSTPKEQARNRRSTSNTGYSGIHMNKNNLYEVKIKANGKTVYLGTKNTLSKAIEMRKQGERRYWTN